MWPKFRAVTYSFGFILAAFSSVDSADAAALMGNTAGGPAVLSPNGMYRVSLDPAPMTADASPSPSELKLAQDKYISYNISDSPQAATGSFNILQYQPFALNTLGGADFTALYDDGVAAPRTDYNWIQFAVATNWTNTETTVDSRVRGSPFYGSLSPQNLPDAVTGPSQYAKTPDIWNNPVKYPSQHVQNPAGGPNNPAGDLLLVDEPFCSYTCLQGNVPSSLVLNTFLVTFTAPTFDKKGKVTKKGTVKIDDGFDWGVKIEKVPQVKPSDTQQTPGTAQGQRSLEFDSSSGQLKFSNEIMTGTGFPDDPVVGAVVDVPTLTLTGRSEGRFVFESDGTTTFDIGTYLNALLPVAYYVPSKNLFYGELTDFTFSSQGSPWIADLADQFDPSSPNFDPNLDLWFTVGPDLNFFDATGGFLLDALTGDVKTIFAADAIPLPAAAAAEPPTIWLLAFGLVVTMLFGQARIRSTQRIG